MNETHTPTENENDQLAQILSTFKIKIDAANAQILQLGLLVEYLYQQISQATELNINLDNYPEWAKNRVEEIEKMATSKEGDQLQEELRREMEAIASQINLTE